MNILIIGSGGREHTIAWALRKSKDVDNIFVSPGNGGTAEIAENVNLSLSDAESIIKFTEENQVGLVVIGPEDPLVNGLADILIEQGISVFGPQKKGAILEGSKSYAKWFMKKYQIPTAEYEEFTDYYKASIYLESAVYPLVLKADGLAAGKGVIIVNNQKEAQTSLDKIMRDRDFGSAGDKVVIEEFLEGEEASILAFVDAHTVVPMVPAQDHKAIYDGDKGPNTGGMGTYSPAPIVDEKLMELFKVEVLDRFMAGLKQEGIVFRGIIFVGLMINNGKQKVLEFNVRFGDPETQVVLTRLKTDLYKIMDAVVHDRLSEIKIEWSPEYAVCVVVASDGYPESYPKGIEITDVKQDGVFVFHAGTKIENGRLVNSGGRVLGVTAMDLDLKKAVAKAYSAVEKIKFEKKYYRKDIAQKAYKYLY
jgi:phosphoribosylamine--glycine ligase